MLGQACGGAAVCLAALAWLPPRRLSALAVSHWRSLNVLAVAVSLVAVSVPGRWDDSLAAGLPVPWVSAFSPKPWAFAIWGAIFAGEVLGAADVARGFHDGRDRCAGATPAFVLTQLCQALWCAAFRPGVPLGCPALCLAAAAACLYASQLRLAGAPPQTTARWLLLVVPRSLHLGWLCAATLVNVNAAVGAAPLLRAAASVASAWQWRPPAVATAAAFEQAAQHVSTAAVASTVFAAAAAVRLTLDGLPSAAAAICWALLALDGAVSGSPGPRLPSVNAVMRALGPVQACLGWILLARAVAEAWRLRRVTASAASVRGASLSAFPLLPYFSQHLEALFTPGWTSLAIAENKTDTAVDSARVMVDLLAVKLRSSTALQIVSYDDEGGTADLRDGAARAVRCHLYKGEAQCDAAEIVASPGVTASRAPSVRAAEPSQCPGTTSRVPERPRASPGDLSRRRLNNLLIAICEAGDGVLVPTPCYGAFPFDIEGCVTSSNALCAREPLYRSPSARNILVPCPLPPPLCVLTEAALEAAVRTHHAERSGAPRVAVLLLTSPSNPLGRVLSPAELAVAVRFCCARGMHLIADEIYAATAFANAPAVPGAAPCAQFVSARVIAERLAADDAEISAWAERQLHVLWGLSKDASSSGIRLGFCHSRSGAVQKAVGLANHFGGCSAFAQHAAAELLKDARQSADLFLRASRQLSQTAAFVCAKLKTLEPRITHVSPDAGMFVWCDLSAARRLRGGVVETEAELLDAIRTTCKLVLTPGRACLASEDGFVRICYAAVPRPELEAAIDRLVAFCQDRLAPDSKKQE